MLAVVLFLQRLVLLKIARTTARCAELLLKPSSPNFDGEFSLPSNLTFGQSLPELEVANLRTGEVFTLNTIHGAPAFVVFCSLSEYKQWKFETLVAFLHNCWHRIDGNIYFIFLNQAILDVEKIPHSDILQTYFGQSLIFCLDVSKRIENTMGLSQTPCIVELDTKSVVSRIGSVNHHAHGDEQLTQ